MPAKRRPAYLLHKPSGQARVRIDGKDHYLGSYGSPESREKYDDLIAEWFARNGDVTGYRLTVDELAILYVQHAETYYVKNGKPRHLMHFSASSILNFKSGAFGHSATSPVG